MQLVVVDYGVGNLRSIAKSLEKSNYENNLGHRVQVSSNLKEIKKADKLVLPGQGSFKACKEGIENIKGLEDELNESVLIKKKPIFGICAGMQLFATIGYEEVKTLGLNWIPGEVIKLDSSKSKLKVPHMGWNELELNNACHPVLDGLGDRPHVYFVHSYYFSCDSPVDVLATVDYGGPISAVVGRDNMVGTQFHPEKSQHAGLKLISNFLKWKP